MNGVVELFKQSWQRLLPHTRMTLKRMVVVNACGIVLVVLLALVPGLLLNSGFVQGSLFFLMGGSFILGGAFVIFYYWTVVQAHRAVKADYFARAFPGEKDPEKTHWSRGEGIMLAAALLGLGAFLPNVLGLVLTLASEGLTVDLLTDSLGVVVTCVLVPQCCRRFVVNAPANTSELPGNV